MEWKRDCIESRVPVTRASRLIRARMGQDHRKEVHSTDAQSIVARGLLLFFSISCWPLPHGENFRVSPTAKRTGAQIGLRGLTA